MTVTEPETLSQGGDGPGPKRRLVLGVFGTVLVVGGAIALAVTGQASPTPRPAPRPLAQVHLQTGPDFAAMKMQSLHRASYTFPLINWGGSSVTIVGAGRSGPGLRLVGVSAGTTVPNLAAPNPPLPITVDGHSTVYLTLAYTVRRCDGVTGRWSIPVTFRERSGASSRIVMVDPDSSGRWPWYHEITSGMCGRTSR